MRIWLGMLSHLQLSVAAAGATIIALAFGISSAIAGKSDDTLNWATDREAAVVDPYYNNTRELVIMGHLGWDGLTFYEPATGEHKPLLATKWDWKDNVTLEVELRKGVKFHDGSDFDADDVVYTINHVSNKDNGVLTYRNVSWMKSAEKLGSHKVRIKLHKPFPAAMAFLSNVVFMVPSGHYDSAPAKADGKNCVAVAEDES